MKKFKEMHEIICPFCGKKPLLIYPSIYFPDFYCEECKKELRFETTAFLKRYFFDRSKDKELCKKHMETYDKHNEYDYCSECRKIKRICRLRKMKFTMEQLIFLSEEYSNFGGYIEKLLKEDNKIKKESQDEN